MVDPAPDPDVVARLTELHIEDPEVVASILARHGLTLTPTDTVYDDPTD